ncbi:MAG: KTSC domain-containing protein [Burkholderiales bacterium]
MERRRVNATKIRSVGYDPSARVLEVEFASGAILQYSGVSAEVHRRLMAAPSPGSYFEDNIEESFSGRRMR